MKPARSVLLLTSVMLVLFLLGGGVALRVGASENPYRQAVLFAEILSLVMENYVDPVEAEGLLEGAYKGMLTGLDPNGAYLTAEEVEEWKTGSEERVADPGLSVLKSRTGLRVIAVDPGSPADEAGIAVGDQIRTVAGRSVRSLSLAQARRLLQGPVGSEVALGLLPTGDRFEAQEIDVARATRRGRHYELEVEQGIAVLSVKSLTGLSVSGLESELGDVRSRAIDTLLLDLRNVADDSPRQAIGLAGLFATGELLRLRDHTGELVESLRSANDTPVWPGEVYVLVNWATASGAEAVAWLVHADRDAPVYGEKTFGLGAEPELLELETGAGLLLSSARWESRDGETWNGEGITPDHEVRGSGDDLAAAGEDQLRKVLEMLTADRPDEGQAKAA